MDDQQVEKEIVEEGKTVPRVTFQYTKSTIPEEHSFTAYDGTRAANMSIGDSWTAHKPTDLLTFCVLVLKNGFTVTGESACVSPGNFDIEVGRRVTRQNVASKIWMLEGYLLKQKLGEQ